MEINIESSWYRELSSEFQKPYFQRLIYFLNLEYENNSQSIFPQKEEIFAAFEACPFDKVKVVILGQDPYPTRGHAHGLSFSVKDEIKPLPKSLQNIFKEIEIDLRVSLPENGNLTRWAKQGVLLLNSILTVREGHPESHSNIGWENFTDAVIEKLNSSRKNIVYLLWGSKAQQKANYVNAQNNLILKAPHPSPLSSYRGFFGCSHFSKANEYLKRNELPEIKW